MAKRVDSELNVGMSMGLRGAVSVPAGYRAAPRSKKYVSKMTHGFFITINSMILYFKHIIHIDDFPLNGHPPSLYIIIKEKAKTLTDMDYISPPSDRHAVW